MLLNKIQSICLCRDANLRRLYLFHYRTPQTNVNKPFLLFLRFEHQKRFPRSYYQYYYFLVFSFGIETILNTFIHSCNFLENPT